MAQIKEEQLKELQGAIEAANAYQLELGKLDIQKHGLLHAFNQANEKINNIKEAIFEEYGKGEINIQTGEFTEQMDEAEIVDSE